MARIYVSSTFNDLKEYREAVRQTLRRLGHEDVAMEYYMAEDKRPLERCLEDVAACDVYIGIFAWRYGFNPPGYHQSITELEYRTACDKKKECLIFLLKGEAPWPFDLIEVDALPKIKALREELSQNHSADSFTTIGDLQVRVAEAINRWEKKEGRDSKAKGASTDWGRYRDAVLKDYQWVRLAVINGRPKADRIFHIPLTEIFVPQISIKGQPNRDVPEEVLELHRRIITSGPANLAHLSEQILEEIFPLKSGTNHATLDTEEQQEPSFPEPIIDVLARERTQVILGGPGSGKSTLLLYTMLLLCEPDRPNSKLSLHLKGPPVPFLIELRQYMLKKAGDFVEFIIQNTKERYDIAIEPESVKALLREENQAIVFFDGLDEVFDLNERRVMIQRFRAFARAYPNVQIVVTSRIVGYDALDLGVEDFRHYTLLDFTAQQIYDFISAWYKHYVPREGDQRDAESLFNRIIENQRLMELAGNPLLLTMMAVLYKYQRLPEKRWELYKKCTDVLLEDLDIKGKGFDPKTLLPYSIDIRMEQKGELLQKVSMYMLEHGQKGRELNAIAYQPLISILVKYIQEYYNKPLGEAKVLAESILTHLRERTYILAEVGEGIFGFVHRTFMEYFAACQIKAEFSAKKADYPWLIKEVYERHWNEDHWQEVLLLLIAMLADQGLPIRDIVVSISKGQKESALRSAFAARCLAEAGEVGVRQKEDQQVAQNLLNKLVQAIGAPAPRSGKSETASFKEEALRAFSLLAPLVGNISPETKALIGRFAASNSLRERMTGWQMELALRSREERLGFALTALQDPAEAVRRGAISALEREWPGKAEVGQAILGLVRTDRIARVRQAGIGALQRAWPLSLDLLDAIESRIKEESSYTYLLWIIEYLVAKWQGNPKAFSLIQEISTWQRAPHESENVRVTERAIQAIAQGWHDYPESLQFLKERMGTMTQPKPRRAALEAIAQGWPQHPETLPLLQACALTDDVSEVRQAAIGAIAQGWRDHAQTLPLLHARALADDAPEVRQAAIGAIAQGWPDEEDSLQLLRIWAINESVSDVRLSAIRAIAQTWRSRYDTLIFLGERSQVDEAPPVRIHALLSLAGFLPKDSTLEQEYYLHLFSSRSLGNQLIDLGENWRGWPSTFSYVKRGVQEDQAIEVRQAAAWALALGWHEHPESLPILQIAATDKAPEVRQAAIWALALGWHSRPNIRDRLGKIARDDEDSGVRLAAIWAYAQGWPHHPDTRLLLRDRIANDLDEHVREILQRLPAHLQ